MPRELHNLKSGTPFFMERERARDKDRKKERVREESGRERNRDKEGGRERRGTERNKKRCEGITKQLTATYLE